MTVAIGLIALAIVLVLYLFVSSGGILWPGGPQLQPEGARNLSIALIGVALLLCGVIFGGAAQSVVSIAQQGNATRDAGNTQLTATRSGGGAGGAEASATSTVGDETGGGAVGERSTQLPAPTSTPNAGGTATLNVASTLDSTATPTANATSTASPTATRPTETPSATPTLTPEPSPTPTATPAALPLDPRELIETVLGNIIPRANDAQAAAILSGDESLVNELWTGQARGVALNSVRNVRSRFIEVTEVSWLPSTEGIRLLSSSTVTAAYTTSETWTFVGTVSGRCPDGSQRRYRFVETYPDEEYVLRLQDGRYSVDQWRLGRVVREEARPLCP
jgi:hypothetical protein